MKKRVIKFTVNAVRWFDKVNGNTYHSVRITRISDGEVIKQGMTYGYGDCYRQTALGIMAVCKWLPVKYRDDKTRWQYEMENNYPILWTVHDGLKREMTDNVE
jgi:hypothetical protein